MEEAKLKTGGVMNGTSSSSCPFSYDTQMLLIYVALFFSFSNHKKTLFVDLNPCV